MILYWHSRSHYNSTKLTTHWKQLNARPPLPTRNWNKTEIKTVTHREIGTVWLARRSMTVMLPPGDLTRPRPSSRLPAPRHPQWGQRDTDCCLAAAGLASLQHWSRRNVFMLPWGVLVRENARLTRLPNLSASKQGNKNINKKLFFPSRTIHNQHTIAIG